MTKQESNMRVCFVARTAYALFNPSAAELPGATHGGAEVDLFLLAKELARDPAYEVHFIVGDFGQPAEEIFDGVHVHACFEYTPQKQATAGAHDAKSVQSTHKRAPVFLQRVPIVKHIWAHFLFGQKINRLKNIKRLALLFKKIHADIYVQEAAGPLTGVCCFLAKVFGTKFIYRTAHDMDCDRSYIEEQNQKGLTDGFLYEWGLMHADAVITQNAGNQKSLSENHKLDSTVIKNAYPIPETRPQKDGSILWVARSVAWKRPFLFIDLARAIPDAQFVMICPRANEEGVDWDELARQAAELPNLTLSDYVPFEEINAYFERASLFVNTSVFEGYPNTFVQAAKNWTPIISLNVNPDNFLETANCGFFCADSEADMIRFTKELLSNADLRGTMSEHAHAYAKKEHDLTVITEQYKAIFKRCIH